MFRTFDIEARNWNKFLIAGSYDIFNDDYQEHDSIASFIEFIFSKENKQDIIYSHFGGIYDFLFILDHYLRNQDFEFNNIINQGSKILSFKAKRKKRTITFICSSGLFPFSLKQLTTMFDVTHKKIDEDVSKITRVTKKLRKYLKHDCMGLAEALYKYSNQGHILSTGMKLTRSSQSFAIFSKFYCQDLPEVSNDVARFARKSYFGGRTEIFKPIFEATKKHPKLYEMDINSLYPSVMHDNTYPSTFSHYESELDLKHEHSITHCLIECPKDLNIPLLGISYNGKFIFPTGIFEGHWCAPELRKALSLGYKILKVYRVAYFNSAGYLFKKFIADFYQKRLDTKDPVEKILFKDFMNHLYGRLAINQERETFTFNPKGPAKIHSDYDFEEYSVRLYSQEKTLRTYSNPALSSFVTSYARLKLYDYFEQVNFDVYYCDTDSVYSKKLLKSSLELGDMKLEDEWDRACFLLPKTYAKYSLNVKKLDLKMKGFPSKKGELNHITYDDFIKCAQGSISLPKCRITRGLARFKTGMKKGDVLTVLDDQDKQLNAKYDKRIIIKDKKEWRTIPIHIEYQTDLFEQ
jgi:hypothetical protein